MKTENNFGLKILNTEDDNKILVMRTIVGLIFISEGILKFLMLQWLGPGRFTEIGFKHAFFWAYLTGAFEIICGSQVLFGFLTRLASVPLLTIMITAFFTAKLPILTTQGFWTFAHEYTTDFSLTLLLILLIIYGGGKWSVDLKILHRKKSPIRE
jgi:putative oxidoreductase